MVARSGTNIDFEVIIYMVGILHRVERFNSVDV